MRTTRVTIWRATARVQQEFGIGMRFVFAKKRLNDSWQFQVFASSHPIQHRKILRDCRPQPELWLYPVDKHNYSREFERRRKQSLRREKRETRRLAKRQKLVTVQLIEDSKSR
jgi:hypothetical protein